MGDGNLWIVGAGPMAQTYAAVLDSMDVSYEVIGRGERSARAFEDSMRREVRRGGVRAAIAGRSAVPDRAIVAVGVEGLEESVCDLVAGGVGRVLVEKPGAIDSRSLERVWAIADRRGAEVVVGYNRRHYEATRAAREMIEEDGGVVSFGFELSEWPHRAEPTSVVPSVRRRWMVAHSSHVLDLAFHLGGRPTSWSRWLAGSLPWHDGAARFAGAGVTDKDATFSYHGDWEAPGRWGLEVLTLGRRLVFRPMEELRVMHIGSLAEEMVALDDRLDRDYKPGLWRQTRAFLDGDDTNSCLLAHQLDMMSVYEEIAGY